MYVLSTCINIVFVLSGNFGVVYKAWYIKEKAKTKVAIKALKGQC